MCVCLIVFRLCQEPFIQSTSQVEGVFYHHHKDLYKCIFDIRQYSDMQVALQLHSCKKGPPFLAGPGAVSFSLMSPQCERRGQHCNTLSMCTFQWLRGSEKPIGGITMVFSGEWRQILTVMPHGNRSEIVGRCFKSSYLWRNVEILRLAENVNSCWTFGRERFLWFQRLVNLLAQRITHSSR